jgi:pyruvate formate lyase activating enzyme
MVGRSVSVRTLLEETSRDRPFFEESGGGVTFSGGEPLMQPGFLLACLRACREDGLPTALDTCGYAPRETLLEAASLTDLVLYDLKLVDDDRHLAETGVPAEPILGNLEALDGAGTETWIRFPLLPGVNDDPENLDAVGRFLSGTETIRRLHILPYHGAGSVKLERLGLEETSRRLDPPPAGAVEAAAQRLAAYALDVRVGG